MSTAGYPGVFPGGLTTGNERIGACGTLSAGLGYPGVFPGALTTAHMTIGAVQIAPTVAAVANSNMFFEF